MVKVFKGLLVRLVVGLLLAGPSTSRATLAMWQAEVAENLVMDPYTNSL